MKQIDFPRLRQAYEYDCGANALEAVLAYYGIEVREELIMKLANTNKEEGTSISGMIKTLQKYKLQFDEKPMSIADLKKYIDNKIPVLILLQAWKRKTIDYSGDFHDGHRVVTIGYNKNQIIFEDPASFEYTFLTQDEFIQRRHSKDSGKKVINYGIAVYGLNPIYSSKKIIHMD